MHQESDPEAADRLALLWAGGRQWLSSFQPQGGAAVHGAACMGWEGKRWGRGNPGLAQLVLDRVSEGRRERITQLSL